MFSVEWLGHKVALKASNGKYICTKKNGQLVAVSDSIGRGQSFVLQPLPLVIKRWLLPLFFSDHYYVDFCQGMMNSSL